MSHLDAERLALIALGEDADPDESAHLQECSLCATEFTELSRAVLVGRSTLTVGDLEAPPDRVWERIAAEVGMAAASAPDVDTDSATIDVAPAADIVDGPAASDSDETPEPKRGTRRWTKVVFALAASVAAVLVVVGVTSILRPAPTELAAAALDAFPGHPGAAGTAVVVEDPDGERRITVELDADAAGTDAYREVWLITADASAIVSLGVLEGSEGTFAIPDDVDIDEYVLVDISEEPLDGDPTHSGDSIVRGELESV